MPRGDAPFKVLDKRIRLPLSIFESVSIDLDSVSPEETRQVLGENEQAYLLIQRVEDVMNLKWALGLGPFDRFFRSSAHIGHPLRLSQ